MYKMIDFFMGGRPMLCPLHIHDMMSLDDNVFSPHVV
jgi:hypothetical protein